MKNLFTQLQLLLFDVIVFSIISFIAYLLFLGINSIGILENIISTSKLFAYLFCQFLVIAVIVGIINEFFIIVGGEK